MKNLPSGRFVFIFIFACVFIQSYTYVLAQGTNQRQLPPAEHYTVEQIVSKIKIDGVLSDEAWQKAVIIDLPYEFLPGDNIPAPVKTKCMITFSKSKLYIGFRCYDPHPEKIRAHLMDRDALDTFDQDDHIAVMIDSFNDERRAFHFRVNPLGVQVDGLFNQIEGVVNYSWDAIWESAGKITDFGYVIEITIPFNQLRFPNTKSKQTWGFSLERSYPRVVQHRMLSHTWDRNSSTFLPYINKITGFAGIVTGKNLEFDPTLALHRTDRRQDFPMGQMERGPLKVEPGLTARWGMTPNLTMSAAINPDFSHVEADAAQLEVNTRFALRYPEKRPFFLEGSDYFQTPLEAVFTRTVRDPLWGVKMSGKINKNAVGFFLDQDQENNLLFPANQGSWATQLEENVLGSVLRYRRDVGKGSTLGLLYTGRLGDDYYNHVAGVDGFLMLSRTKNISFQYLHSQTRYPDQISTKYQQSADSFGGRGMFFNLSHLGRNLWYWLEYEDISPGFRADFGFIPRADFRRYTAYLQPIIWGKPKGWFNRIIFVISGDYITDHNNEMTDRNFWVNITYLGPWQSVVQPRFINRRERYGGILYDLNLFRGYIEMKPAGGLKYFFLTRIGDSIDYTNVRSAHSFFINPGIEFNLGKHLNMNLSHIYERLSFEGKKIYTANLFQARMVYNFNLKTFLRAIVQYSDISRNTGLYIVPTDPVTRTLFTQLLFSYKINPQTVLFLGYSDNHYGIKGIDLTRTDRTFFLKIGYALVL